MIYCGEPVLAYACNMQRRHVERYAHPQAWTGKRKSTEGHVRLCVMTFSSNFQHLQLL